MLDGWFGGWTCMCWDGCLVVELLGDSNGRWIVCRMLGLLAWQLAGWWITWLSHSLVCLLIVCLLAGLVEWFG